MTQGAPAAGSREALIRAVVEAARAIDDHIITLRDYKTVVAVDSSAVRRLVDAVAQLDDAAAVEAATKSWRSPCE